MIHVIAAREMQERVLCESTLRAQLLAQHPTIYWMVPEQFTLQTEIDLMQCLEAQAITRIQVMSFERLAREVLTQVGGAARASVDETGRHMLLRSVMEKKKAQLPLYGGYAQKTGFLQEVGGLITELKKMQVEPERLAQIAQRPLLGQALSARLLDLSLIYASYRDALGGLYEDSADRIRILAEKIPKAHYLSKVLFVFEGFTGFTELEWSVIESLLCLEAPLLFSLTLDPQAQADHEIFSVPLDTFMKLKKLSVQYASALQVEQRESLLDRSLPIGFLGQHLYDYAALPFEGSCEGIRLYQALTIESEARQIAREITRLVQDKSWRYRDIQVVMASPENYTAALERAFSEFMVPYFMDRKRSVMSSPLTSLVFAFLDMHSGFLSYEAVFGFLKTGFSGLSDPAVLALERFVLRWGISGRRWFDQAFWQDARRYEEDEDPGQVQAAAVFIQELYQRTHKAFSTAGLGKERARKLLEVLENLQVPEKLKQYTEQLLANEQLQPAERQSFAAEVAQSWQALCETLEQFVGVFGEEKISPERLRVILEDGLAQYETAVVPPAIDQVMVLTLERSRSKRPQALFVCGCNDGWLPIEYADTAILGEHDKRQMAQLGLSLPSSRVNRSAEERYAIWSAFSSPTEQLTLSYSLSDRSLKPLRPSALVSRLQELFKEIRIDNEIADQQVKERSVKEQISFLQPTLRSLGEHLRQAASGKPIDAGWFSVYDYLSRQEPYRAYSQRLLQSLFLTNPIAPLPAETAQKLYQMPLAGDARRFESFARCPFEHFVRYGLKPSRRQVYEERSIFYGPLMRQALDAFARQAEEFGGPEALLEDPVASEQLLGSIFNEMVERDASLRERLERSRKDAHVFRRVRQKALGAAREYARQASLGDFRSAGHQMQMAPLKITTQKDRSIFLENKIDRLDVLEIGQEKYLSLIQYTVSQEGLSLGEIWQGLSLELMSALLALLSSPSPWFGAQPAAVLTYPMMDRLIKADGLDFSKIVSEKRKLHQLRGYVLQDPRILAAFDRDAPQNPSMLSLKIKKDGHLTEKGSLTADQFQMLLIRIQTLIGQMGDAILEGEIGMEPFAQKAAACSKCRSRPLCSYEPALALSPAQEILIPTEEQVKQWLYHQKP